MKPLILFILLFNICFVNLFLPKEYKVCKTTLTNNKKPTTNSSILNNSLDVKVSNIDKLESINLSVKTSNKNINTINKSDELVKDISGTNSIKINMENIQSIIKMEDKEKIWNYG